MPVQAGEALSERQLLNGLMVHSANNFADMLARWDSGTVTAFVVKMNATASGLGMTDTHYADANGLSESSQSSAQDQLRLAMRAMSIPTFAAVVDQPTVTEPVAGVVTNFVQAIGTDGVVGVKSGFTQAAMGCLVLAADRVVDGPQDPRHGGGHRTTGADPLDAANAADLALIDAVRRPELERPVAGGNGGPPGVGTPMVGQWRGRPVRMVVTLLAWHRCRMVGSVWYTSPSATSRPAPAPGRGHHSGARPGQRRHVTDRRSGRRPTVTASSVSWKWRLMHG